MINKYLLKSLFLYCAIFQEKNKASIFQYDPYLRFPVSFCVGSISGLGIKFLKKDITTDIPRFMIIFGILSTAFNEILYKKNLKDNPESHQNKNENQAYSITKQNKIKRINIFIHGS